MQLADDRTAHIQPSGLARDVCSIIDKHTTDGRAPDHCNVTPVPVHAIGTVTSQDYITGVSISALAVRTTDVTLVQMLQEL